MAKTNSKYSEDWLPIVSITNGMINLENKYKVTGVKIRPRNIFILDPEAQDAVLIALKNFYNLCDFEFWIIAADRPVDISLYVSQLQLLYNQTPKAHIRKIIMEDLDKAQMYVNNEVVDTEYYLLFKEKDNDVIQKQLDTLIQENVLRETYGKNPKIYYSENLKKHYMAKNGKLYELTDVKFINKKNQVVTKAGKPVNPEQAAVKETTIKTIQEEVRNSGAQFGKQFADNVIGCSSGEQTKKAYDILDKNVNKYNIRYFIDAYTKEDTWYSDKICRQIMTEDDFKDKYTVIKRIISLVIQYCEDKQNRLNLTSKEMQYLKNILKELTENSDRLLTDNELKDIDKNILKVLNIDN